MTFNNYFDLLANIMVNGEDIVVRDLKIKELTNIVLDIEDCKECIFYLEDIRTFEYVTNYLKGELCWYLNGNINMKYILKYSKFWNKVCDENGEVNSNYGNHIFSKLLDNKITNFNNCLQILNKDINSRRAIMFYNEPKFMFNNEKDYVCTQTQQFLYRKGKLNSIVYIRSSDAIFGLTYDIPWWSFVLQRLAKELGVEPGYLSIHIGSSHIYEHHFKMFDNLFTNEEKRMIEHFEDSFNFYESSRSEIFQIGSFEIKESAPIGLITDWYEKNFNNYFEIKRQGE